MIFGLAMTYAQVQSPGSTHVALPSDRFPANWYPQDTVAASTFAPQTGAPYTAVLVRTFHLRKDPQGKEASRSGLQARDSAGRQRFDTESSRPDGRGGTVIVRSVEVDDPVSHCSFRWAEPVVAPDTPMAIVACMSRTVHYTSRALYADVMITEPQEDHTFPNVMGRSEPLGKKQMEGLEAIGMRRTQVATDPQTHVSNKRVAEMWYSPELQELLNLRQTSDLDPDLDFKLTHIQRGEPPASLFYPPAGYKIEPGH